MENCTNHLVLVLHQELDTLDRRSRRFRDGLEEKTMTLRNILGSKRAVLTADTPPIIKSTVKTEVSARSQAVTPERRVVVAHAVAGKYNSSTHWQTPSESLPS